MTYGMTGCISPPPGRRSSGRGSTTIAPTSAASSSTDSTSNGSTQARKISRAQPLGACRAAGSVDRGPAVGVDEQRGQAERRRRRRPAAPGQRGPVEVVAGADRRPGQHHGEQQQHHHRADVDQHLDPGDQLGGEHQVQPGHRAQRDDQPQPGAHHVPGGDDEPRRSRPRPRRAPAAAHRPWSWATSCHQTTPVGDGRAPYLTEVDGRVPLRPSGAGDGRLGRGEEGVW